jgi:hypothetical protein
MSNAPQEPSAQQQTPKENILESLPRSFRKIWASMTPEQHKLACLALFTGRGDSREQTQRDILGEISSYRGWSTGAQLKEVIRNLSDADKAQACLEVAQTAQLSNFFYIEAIREWVIHHHITAIGEYLDAVGIPNEKGIVDEIKVPIEKAKLVKLMLLHRDKPLEVSTMYIGFILADASLGAGARKKQANTWMHAAAALQEALAKPLPIEPVNQADLVHKPKETEYPRSSLVMYERQLLRSLVDGAISRTSTLKGVEAEQMVRQLIDCSASQPRHCFLLGFAQAIHGRAMELIEGGATEERNRWHAAGYLLGRRRVVGDEQVYAEMGNGAALDRTVEHTTRNRADLFECGTTVAKVLSAAGDHPRLIKLCKVLKEISLGRDNFSVCDASFNLASRLIAEQKYEAAIELIDAAREVLERMPIREEDKGIRDLFLEKGLYQKASGLLGLRSFKDAQAIFAKMIADEKSTHRMGARVWMSLSKSGVNRVEEIFPQVEKGKYAEMMAKLHVVSRQVEEDGAARHRLAQICSGLWFQSQRRHKDAISAFDLALSEIPLDSSYRHRNIRQWTSLCRAVSLVHELNDECSHDIKAAFRDAKESGLKPATWYLLEIASPLGNFADPELVELLGRLLPEGDLPSYYKAQWEAGVVKSDVRLQVTYLAWLESSNEPHRVKWAQAAQLLEAGWRDGGQSPEDALDFLTFLSFQDERLAEQMIDILTRLGPSDGMLGQNEIATLKARLHASKGELQQAVGLLAPLFFNVANAPDTYLQQMALAIFDDIKEMGGDVRSLEALRSKLIDQLEPDGELDDDSIAAAGEMLVLYVGGNETQKRYEEEVRGHIAAKYPNVKIEYHCPGWSSNWNKAVDVIKPRLQEADGLVLSYYVRTMFGRTIRKACPDNCPWWGSQGHGKASIIRGLEKAIQHAALRRARN